LRPTIHLLDFFCLFQTFNSVKINSFFMLVSLCCLWVWLFITFMKFVFDYQNFNKMRKAWRPKANQRAAAHRLRNTGLEKLFFKKTMKKIGIELSSGEKLIFWLVTNLKLYDIMVIGRGGQGFYVYSYKVLLKNWS